MLISRRNILNQIWKVLKQLNPKNIEKEAERAISVVVIAPVDLLQDAATFLLGDDPGAYEKAADKLILLPPPLDESANQLLPRCDIILCNTGMGEEIHGVRSNRIFEFTTKDDLPLIMRKILHNSDFSHTHLPLARAFPGIRGEIAVSIVQTVSVENTIFVVSTSLGNVIPNPLQPLVSLAESMGDVVVLTVNQIRMMWRLAAAFGRKPGYKEQAPEIASVVGAAFGWRSIARELVGLIPVAGVVPKAAIAFAGSWAVGDGIIYYYTTGKKLNKEQLKARFEAALEKGRSTADSILSKIKSRISTT